LTLAFYHYYKIIIARLFNRLKLLVLDFEFELKHEFTELSYNQRKEMWNSIRRFLRVWWGDHRDFSTGDYSLWRKNPGFSQLIDI